MISNTKELHQLVPDALVEMLHKWHESIEVTSNIVRVLFSIVAKHKQYKSATLCQSQGIPMGAFPGDFIKANTCITISRGWC